MKKNSISRKLSAILLFTCLVLTALCFVSIQIISEVSNQALFRQSLEASIPMRQAVLKELQQVEQLTYQLLADQEIQNGLNIANLAASREEYAYYKVTLEVQRRLGELLMQRPAYVDSVGITDLQYRTVLFGKSLSTETETRLKEIIRTELSQDGQPQWFALEGNGETQLLCLRTCRNLTNFDLSPNGYLFCTVSVPSLLRKALGNTAFSSHRLLLSLNGETVYSSLPLPDAEADALFSEQSSNHYTIRAADGRRFFFSVLQADGFGLGFVSAQDITQLTSTVTLFRFGLFITAGLVAMITVAVSLKRTADISSRITQLTKIVDRTYDDNFRIDVQELTGKSEDEITRLAKQYLELTQRIDKLVNEVLTRKLLFKESQIRMLQSQINPHFIYNTLDTVNALACRQETSEISQVVVSLANLMHYSLDDNMLSYVDDEIRIGQQYLSIQKLRYKARLEAELFVRQDCLNIELPKMLLQPLMENAIKYSAEKKVGTSRIKLRIWAHGGDLVITMLDNGIGLNRSIRDQILRREFDKLPGHGLKSVFLRLENLFGKRLKISIRCAEGRYTAIRLVLVGQCDFRRETPCTPL